MKPTYEELEEQNSQLKHEFKMIQETSHLKYQEMKRLERENLRMREALKYYAEGNGSLEKDEDFVKEEKPAIGYHNSGKLARTTLQYIPHTDKLAKQREADLKVISAAGIMFSEIGNGYGDSQVKVWKEDWERLKTAIQEREKIYEE